MKFTKTNSRVPGTVWRRATIATLALSVLTILLIAPAATSAGMASFGDVLKGNVIEIPAILQFAPQAMEVPAVPGPTPPDQALDQASADELVKALTDAAENVLDDTMDANEVEAAKAKIAAAFGRRGSMAGKTGRQIADLYLADMKAVAGAGIQDQMSEDIDDLLADRDSSPDPVKGPNVTEVYVQGNANRPAEIADNFTVRMVLPKKWQVINSGGDSPGDCSETGRDEWSVYMTCPLQSGNSTLMLNLFKKEVSRDGTVIGTVTSADNLNIVAKSVPSAPVAATAITLVEPTPEAANCGSGLVKGSDGTCVVEVKFYHQDNITPADARSMAARNNWAIASLDQVNNAFNKAGLDVFAYAQINTGQMCVAVQKDVSIFKRGTNCGIAGGNQGFLYVLKDALREQASMTYKTVDEYIRSLNYDRDLLLAVQPDAGPPKPLGPPSDTPSGDPSVVCINQRMKFGKNFDALQSLQPNTGIIYPGAALYADSRLADGTPGSITLKRAPSRLTITNLSAPVDPIVVNDPDSQNVNVAIGVALQNFFRKYPGARSTGQSGFSYFEAYSKDQLALNLDFKAEWLTGSAGAIFNFNTSSEKTVLFVVAKDVFYTVDAVLPRTPGAYFDPSVTVADAVNSFDSTKPPAFVQSVDYGRMILFRLETNNSVTTADLKAAFAQKAGDNKIDVKAGFDYEKIRRQTDIKYVQLGGGIDDKDVVPVNFDQLKPLIDRGRTFSPSNPGAPLKYKIKFLDFDGYNTARMGDSTEYTERTCKVVPQLSFKVRHRGAYITEVKVTYLDKNGRLVVHPNSATGRTAGLDDLFNIPGDAKKVHLFIRMDTGVGLVTLFDKDLTGEQMDDMCFTTVGTTIIGRDLVIEPCDPNKRNRQP